MFTKVRFVNSKTFSHARFLFSDYIARHQQLCCVMTCNVVAEIQKKEYQCTIYFRTEEVY